MKHTGSCHCGAVVIEVDAPAEVDVYECNCSMCERTGFLHLIASQRTFRLLQGKDDLITYTFNTRVAQHYFCRYCGCKPYYIPRSNPDGFSVNFRCLNKSEFNKVNIIPFDGQNWEAKGSELAHLSK